MNTSPVHPVSRVRWRQARAAAALMTIATIALAEGARATQDEPDPGAFLLVTRDAQVRSIRLAEINEQSLVHMDAGRGWVTLDLRQCVALLNPAAENIERPASGLLMLADGQRLPGEAIVGGEVRPETLAWSHPWLGRLDVPLRQIESVLFTADAVAPPSGNADVVALANGDRREGFIIAIGDPVSLEVGEAGLSQVVNVPLDRVTALTMVVPRHPGKGRRVWFTEGTVLDVQAISVGDDQYVRLIGAALAPGASAENRSTSQSRAALADIAAILFDRDALVPLASLQATRIEGPPTRYILPRPVAENPDAALSLSAMTFSGPLVARYSLPAGCQRFVAEAELPRDMRVWGDCELIVRSDDAEVFRTRLNAMTPSALVSAPLSGRELTIEITEGEYGPIQDVVRLHRPMLLKGLAR